MVRHVSAFDLVVELGHALSTMAHPVCKNPGGVAVKFGAGKFQVTDFRVVTESRGSSVLGGLHHEYRLEEVAA